MKKHRRTKRFNKDKAPALVDMTPWKCDDPHKYDLIKQLKTKTNEKNNMNRIKKFWNKLNSLIKRGIQLLVIGTSPLLIAIGLDALGIIDGGNFLLFGMTAALFFYPSLLLIVFGVIENIIKYYFKRK